MQKVERLIERRSWPVTVADASESSQSSSGHLSSGFNLFMKMVPNTITLARAWHLAQTTTQPKINCIISKKKDVRVDHRLLIRLPVIFTWHQCQCLVIPTLFHLHHFICLFLSFSVLPTCNGQWKIAYSHDWPFLRNGPQRMWVNNIARGSGSSVKCTLSLLLHVCWRMQSTLCVCVTCEISRQTSISPNTLMDKWWVARPVKRSAPNNAVNHLKIVNESTHIKVAGHVNYASVKSKMPNNLWHGSPDVNVKG